MLLGMQEETLSCDILWSFVDSLDNLVNFRKTSKLFS